MTGSKFRAAQNAEGVPVGGWVIVPYKFLLGDELAPALSPCATSGSGQKQPGSTQDGPNRCATMRE